MRLLYGGGVFKTRMYRSFSKLWNGWERIFFLLFCDRIWLLPIVALFIFILSLIPYGALLFSPGLGLAQLFFMHLSAERAFAYLGADRRYVFAHPLGCLAMAGILLSAFWKKAVRRGVTWRGRRYHEWKGG